MEEFISNIILKITLKFRLIKFVCICVSFPQTVNETKAYKHPYETVPIPPKQKELHNKQQTTNQKRRDRISNAFRYKRV